jgi:hypothetical protein
MNANKLTADTITDEQIRELRSSLPESPEFGGFEWQRVRECEVALFDIHSVGAPERRKLARARCAEILNARNEVA